MPKNKTSPADTSDSMPSNVMIYHYPKALCHEHLSGSDGNDFISVSFKYKDSWASFIVSKDDIQQSVNRNGDAIPNRVNILLGVSDDIRSVSIQADDGTYVSQPMYNRTISTSIVADRKNYLRSIAV